MLLLHGHSWSSEKEVAFEHELRFCAISFRGVLPHCEPVRPKPSPKISCTQRACGQDGFWYLCWTKGLELLLG